VKVALPLLSGPVPRIFEPSLKLTTPVAAEGDTVAVNVTACPNETLTLEAVSVTVVDGLVIVTETAELALLLHALSPPYSAVREWDPAVKDVVEKDALPPLSVPVPSVVVPSLKVTVPVQLAGATVAVRVRF
jgi:hypothetical protein